MPSAERDLCNCYKTVIVCYTAKIRTMMMQGSHKPGKPGIVREFCKPGKVREFEICSGNFYNMSHGLRLAY